MSDRNLTDLQKYLDGTDIGDEVRESEVVNLRGNLLIALPHSLPRLLPNCKTLNLLDNPLQNVSAFHAYRLA